MRSDEYFAGFFDGEGCLDLYDGRNLRAQTVNTNAEVLQMFRERFGGSVGARTKPTSPRHKQTFYHAVHGRGAYDMLVALRPYLIVKAQRVDELLPDKPPAIRERSKHGTDSRYSRGCRCVKCRAAASSARKTRKRLPENPTHGKEWVYRAGCRCDLCREAAREAVQCRRHPTA